MQTRDRTPADRVEEYAEPTRAPSPRSAGTNADDTPDSDLDRTVFGELAQLVAVYSHLVETNDEVLLAHVV